MYRRGSAGRPGKQAAGRWQKTELKKKKSEIPVTKRPLPPFIEAVKEMRRTLLEFSSDDGEESEDTITEDHTSAMRVYMSQKYGLTSKVGSKVKLSQNKRVSIG